MRNNCIFEDIIAMGHNQVIKYKGVRINEGNGYDIGTGIFTAPMSGLYLFSIFVEDDHDPNLRTQLRADGDVVSQAVAEA